MLLCSGFKQNIDGVHINLDDNNLNLCIAVGTMIQERIDEEQRKLNQEREKIKQQTKKKQQEYLNKNNKKKEELKKRIAVEQKDLSQEFKPKCSSKAMIYFLIFQVK